MKGSFHFAEKCFLEVFLAFGFRFWMLNLLVVCECSKSVIGNDVDIVGRQFACGLECSQISREDHFGLLNLLHHLVVLPVHRIVGFSILVDLG